MTGGSGQNGPYVFVITTYGTTYTKTGGANDLFEVDTTNGNYNTYQDSPGATIEAVINGAFIGLQGNFSAGNGIGTISANGYSNVVIAGNGATLDLSSVTVAGSVTLLANQGGQTITGSAGNDIFLVTGYSQILNGDGGSDLFLVDTTNGNYNTYQDSTPATIEADTNGAFIGIQGNFNAGNGIGTISANGYSNVVIAGNGATLDLSSVTVSGSVTLLANRGGQTITGSAGNDTFLVTGYSQVLNGDGGSDLFLVDTTNGNYNTYQDSTAATIEADTNGAFIGIQANFGAGNGIGTISANGYSNVVIAGNGATLDLSSVTVAGSVTLLANQGGQTITGSAGNDIFLVTGYSQILNGDGGSDLFLVDTTNGNYNTYQDSTPATIEADTNGAFIGIQGNFNAGNGIATISANGFANVLVAGNGATLDLSSVTVSGSVTLLANQGGQTITGSAGNDIFLVTGYSQVLNGDGGSDLFLVDTTNGNYNTYQDSTAATIEADTNGAFIGIQANFGAGNGIGTISANGYSNVVIAGNGATLDLSSVTVAGSVTLLANQGGQTITGSAGNDIFLVTGYSQILNGDGGSDLFLVDTTNGNYNTYQDSTPATIEADTNGAFIGIQGNFNAGNGIATISANGFANVLVAGNGATLDLSSVTVSGSVTLLANRGGQTITGSAGNDIFLVTGYSQILNGDGGSDLFLVDTTNGNYNTYQDSTAATIEADTTGAFIGIQGNFNATNDITTISANGFANAVIAGNGATLDLSSVTVSGSVTLLANQGGQTITGSAGNDIFLVTGYSQILNGDGGSDLFLVDTTNGNYNTYQDSTPATIEADTTGAFIGIQGNFNAGNGIATISANGYSNVVIAGNGATLDLSSVTVAGSVTLLANQGGQTITGSAGNDIFLVTGYSQILNGDGGSDLFLVDTTNGNYNTYQDSTPATIEADTTGAFIGIQGNFSAGNDITTISANGFANAVIAGNGATLDLSSVTVSGAMALLANQNNQIVKVAGNGHELVKVTAGSESLFSSAAGYNVFQFLSGFSNETITGFNLTRNAAGNSTNAAHDVIDLSNLSGAPTNWTTLLGMITNTVGGAQVTINGQKIIIAGVTKAQLSASDFNIPAPSLTPANGTPVATNAQGAVLGTIAAGIGGDTLSVHLVSDTAFASLSTLTLVNGTLDYTPGLITAGNAGADVITYTVTDATNGASIQEQQSVSLVYNPITTGLAQDTGASASDGITSNDALSGTADPNARITVSQGGTILGSTTANVGGAWSLTPAGLADGTHTLVVAETYASGASGTITTGFTLDTSAPTIQVTVPAPIDATSTAGAVVNLLAISSDAIDANSDAVSFTENGLAVTSGSVFSIGAHTLLASSTDRAGNTGTLAFGFTVIDPGPTAGNAAVTIPVGTTIDLTSLVLGTDNPGPAGGVLTITSDNTLGTLGSVVLSNGILIYQATGVALQDIAPNGSATDHFLYTITDQNGVTSSGTVGLTITNPAIYINGPQWGGGTITGTTGAAIITAAYSDNVITTGGGNDVVNAGQGQATVYVESSNAVVNLSGWNNRVQGYDLPGTSAWTGADGIVIVTGSQGDTVVLLGNGTDNVTLGGDSNVVRVGNGNDTINAGAGNTQVTVGSGTDRITVGGYNNTIDGVGGNKTVTGPLGDSVVSFSGTSGNDQITLAGYDNQVVLGAPSGNGNNSVVAGDGNDTVIIGGGNNTVALAGYNNLVTIGGDGNNTIVSPGGFAQGTVLLTGNGNNTVNLDGFNNLIAVGNGNNTISTGFGAGTVVAGSGNNIVTVSGWNNVLDLGGGTNHIAFLSGGSNEMTLDIGAGLGGSTQFTGLAATQDDVFDLTTALAEAHSSNWMLLDEGSNAALIITDSSQMAHTAAMFVGVSSNQVMNAASFIGPDPTRVGA